MTRKELRDVLDEAAGDPPRVDLAEAAWARGVGMRRRRRAVFAGGGTLLAAAAVVGAMVISGGIAPDEDMAPAVPTSSPGPTETEQTPTEQTQEDPGPVSTESAVTFMFHRAGTNPTIETSSMQSLDSIAVPSQANLTGTTWDLVPIGNAAEASDFLDLTFGDEDTIGVEAPTTLNFRDRGGDTLLSMATGCAGPSFQEGLELGADGHFAGQPAVSLAIGCDGPDSGGFWGPALERGGWLHQPHEDVLLLSVLPDGLTIDAPTTDGPTSDGPTTDAPGSEDPTDDLPASLADAHTVAFTRPGTDAGFDPGQVPPLAEQDVPVLEDLAGTSWELVPYDGPWFAEGPNDSSGITMLEGEDYESLVPTQLQFVEEGQSASLSVALADCGDATLPASLELDGAGRFAGQDPTTADLACDSTVQAAEDFWMALIADGGWLHQPDENVLLLSIVAPDGLVPEAPPPPEAPDPTQGVAALDIGDGLPDGWAKVVVGVGMETRSTTTCLLPGDETQLFYPWCTAGVEVQTGIDPLTAEQSRGWWDPADPSADGPTEQCYVARQGYGAPDNTVTFAADPESGATTIAGHPVEWFRWQATCAGGEAFTAEAWRVMDLGIQLRSMDGSQEVEPLVRALLEEGSSTTVGHVAIQVSEPVGDTLTGELQVWNGAHQGTGEQVTFTITDETRCLITTPEGVIGADLALGPCDSLSVDLEEYPIVTVTVTPDGDVLTAHVPSTF